MECGNINANQDIQIFNNKNVLYGNLIDVKNNIDLTGPLIIIYRRKQV